MTRLARICFVVTLLGPCVTAAAVSAQSVTGPSVEAKKPDAVVGVDLASSTADVAVARLVYEPIKVLGTRRFTPEGRISLKQWMEEAESGVRAVMERLSAGTIGEAEARSELAAVLERYRTALKRLLATR